MVFASQAKTKILRKGDLHPMAKVTEITEHFQHFVSELQDSFWGDMYGRTRVAWQQFWNTESLRARDQRMELAPPGKTAASSFLHKRLDITLNRVTLDFIDNCFIISTHRYPGA